MALILVVEDDEHIQVLAESILQERGHETLSAGTAEQALALIDGERKPDVLFIDIRLHDDIEAGLHLAQEAVKRVPSLRVLYTTGYGITDGIKALFVEPYVYIGKPYTAEQLVMAVSNLTN